MPLFMRFQVERSSTPMFRPKSTLKSGGYIVINQTEALVAIDVNSGKATREHNHRGDRAARPISRRPTKSRGSCGCATLPG